MPIFEAVCPGCGTLHHDTSDLPVGQRPGVTDFRSVSGAEAPAAGAAATCPSCSVNLVVRRRPPAEAAGRRNGAGAVSQSVNGILTLFEARPDETVVRMDEQPDGRFLVVTTKRILVVDISAVLHHP